MKLIDALNLSDAEVISLIGGGGKTTALIFLKEQLEERGYRVCATTTTKMQASLLKNYKSYQMDSTKIECLDVDSLNKSLIYKDIDIKTDKLLGITLEWVDELWSREIIDFIIVEADGSKGRGLKAFAEHEPQIPKSTTETVILLGLDCLGKPLTEEFVHRAGLVSDITGTLMGDAITPETIIQLFKNKLGLTAKIPPKSKITLILNKADTLKNSESKPYNLPKLASEILRQSYKQIERVLITQLNNNTKQVYQVVTL